MNANNKEDMSADGGNPSEYIDTVAGRAYYDHTDVEDKYGRWCDHWNTPHYWVIHEGIYHYVYVI